MAPGSHFLMSWVLASTSTRLNRRERIAITLAGLSPDIDGLGLILDGSISSGGISSELYVKYHHVLAHNLAFAFCVAMACLVFGRYGCKCVAAILAFTAVNLHILADIMGSRGPDGHQWPVNYLYPFSDQMILIWPGQWELNSWPNYVIFGTLLAVAILLAHRNKSSPLEIFSLRLDAAAQAMIRRYIFRKHKL